MRRLAGALAYERSAGFRSLRQQEAEVFQRVNARLRSARQGDSLVRGRAVADNERLWITLMDLVREPENPLAAGLRAAIVSVGLAVRREHKQAEPDLGFLIGINEHFAAGLSG